MLNNRQSGRRRSRGRGPSGNGHRDNQSRIDNRARGNAPQMLEKFKNLAREAQMQGDRVMTEYYLQFADHYFRIVAENRARFEENRQPRRDEWQGDEGMDGDMASVSESDELLDQGSENEYAGQGPGQGQGRRDSRRNFDRNRQRPDRNNSNNVYAGEEPAAAEPEEQVGLSIDILPPAIGVTADPLPDIDEAPAPRRRGRPKRSAEAEVPADA